MLTAVAALASIFIAGCSSKVEIPANPSVSAPTRVMLKEKVNVYLKGVGSGTTFTVDFGDGTPVVEAVTPSAAVHAYSESADWKISVSSDALDEDFTKTIRCYPLKPCLQHSRTSKTLPTRKSG